MAPADNVENITLIDPSQEQPSEPQAATKRSWDVSLVSLAIALLALATSLTKSSEPDTPRPSAAVAIAPGTTCSDESFVTGWGDDGMLICDIPFLALKDVNTGPRQQSCDPLAGHLVDPTPCVLEAISALE